MSAAIVSATQLFQVQGVEVNSNPEGRLLSDLYCVFNEVEVPNLDKVLRLEGFENTLVQFILTDGQTVTYQIPTEHYEEVLRSLENLNDDQIDWQKNPPAFSKWVNRRAIIGGRTYIELPLDAFDREVTTDLLDEVTGHDYDWLKGASDSVITRTKELTARVTKLAEQVADTSPIKDHDLYLTFKGSEDLKHMVVGLERVYPELPEGGVLLIGDTPLTVEQWEGTSESTLFHVRKIIKQVGAFNSFIDELRSHFKSPGQVALLPTFEKEVRTQLMAASHFMKQLYGFDMRFAKKLVFDAANDIIGRLETRGGNIALDLNSWIVWDYSAPELPTRSLVPELNFLELYLNRRTDSFMEALYGLLLNTPHPLIKPYSRREVVNGDDGIPLGTIFPSNQPPVIIH